MRRLLMVILFMLVFIAPLFFYLGWSLNSGYGWILLTIIFSLILSFPFVRQRPSIIHLTFLSMGFLSYLIVFVILKDLLRLLGLEVSISWSYLLAFTAVLLGTWIAHKGPTIVRLRLPISQLHPDLEGLKIVQISDLHIGPTIGKRYVSRIVESVNALDADIIALTGDIGDGPVTQYREDITPIGQLKSSLGTFYVTGNHEYYWNANEWLSVMNNYKTINLINRGKIVQVKAAQVLVGGIPDPASGLPQDLQTVFKHGEKTDFKILLSHRPGPAQEASRLGFQLQLSGHTHGGQFFPWTIIVRFVHKYFLGHYQVNGMWLNVNSGTGSWGPFLRLGTTSEITLIELFHSNKSLE